MVRAIYRDVLAITRLTYILYVYTIRDAPPGVCFLYYKLI